jgi:hypothetical protein
MSSPWNCTCYFLVNSQYTRATAAGFRVQVVKVQARTPPARASHAPSTQAGKLLRQLLVVHPRRRGPAGSAYRVRDPGRVSGRRAFLEIHLTLSAEGCRKTYGSLDSRIMHATPTIVFDDQGREGAHWTLLQTKPSF